MVMAEIDSILSIRIDDIPCMRPRIALDGGSSTQGHRHHRRRDVEYGKNGDRLLRLRSLLVVETRGAVVDEIQ